ncbi:ATP-binding protein, partial [Leucobacter sp. M11]|uniref:ATP-binding protein n=1 Tax=Leucobacter sp. M11 TaxID=2993565 RepID=UPI002D7F5FAE
MTVSQTLLEEVNRQLGQRHRLLVALSGGLDSSVLLHILVSLRATSRPDLVLRAIYIHHGLSRHADQWSEH